MAISFDLTSYYAKRIIGDAAATTSDTALLQSGVDTSMWIFGHNRTNYGIKYLYDSTNNADKIEFHGGSTTTDTIQAWIQLNNGNASFNGTLGVTGLATFDGDIKIKSTASGSSYYSTITSVEANTNITWTIPSVSANRYFIGTTSSSYTANSVAYADSTSSIGFKASANGALYATTANGELSWGTLPVGQGGTNVTSHTAKTLVYSDANGTAIQAASHYADANHVAIKTTSAPTETFYVNGTTGISDNTTIGGTLGVTGATTLSSSLSISGTTTHSDLIYIKGSTNDSTATANKAKIVFQDASGNNTATISSFYSSTNKGLIINPNPTSNTGGIRLQPGGQCAFGTGCTLAIGESSQTTYTLEVNGTTNITGNTTIGGTLGVTGATTLSSTLGVTGATTLSSTLAVGDAITLTGSTTGARTINTSNGNTLTIDAGSTLYLNRTDASIIFQYEGTAKCRLDKNSYFIPETTNTLQIGSSSKKWNAMYATTFYGDLDGNASTATKLAAGKTLKVDLTSTSASTAFDGSANITDIGVSGSLGIGNGGTGATTADDAANNLLVPYIGSAAGTQVTANSNIDTDYNAYGTYYSASTTRTGTLSGTIPYSTGFKFFTIGSYNGDRRLQISHASGATFLLRYSSDGGTTWAKWYKIVRIASGDDNKTFSAVGGTGTPVYVDSDGIIQACTSVFSHSHGNITSAGALQTTDITIASGDKLVVTDSSNSSKVARSSISFDGSTDTKCLTQKGTWETFSTLTIGTTSDTAMAGDTTVTNVSVSQDTSTTTWRKIMLSGGNAYSAWSTSASTARTNALYVTRYASIQPSTGSIKANKVYNAVWNDYAECRQVETEEPGYCVTETNLGIMVKTTKRLQAGCKITSDTFGSCMGETEKAKTPIAVAGRVLAYPYRAREEYILGAAVCSAPNGTVDIMTRDEIMMYPERIVGTVSEIPTYEVWNCGHQEGDEDIKVNGRIWIYVK